MRKETWVLALDATMFATFLLAIAWADWAFAVLGALLFFLIMAVGEAKKVTRLVQRQYLPWVILGFVVMFLAFGFTALLESSGDASDGRPGRGVSVDTPSSFISVLAALAVVAIIVYAWYLAWHRLGADAPRWSLQLFAACAVAFVFAPSIVILYDLADRFQTPEAYSGTLRVALFLVAVSLTIVAILPYVPTLAETYFPKEEDVAPTPSRRPKARAVPRKRI